MTAPSAPQNVKVVNPETKELTVTWEAPEDINGVILGYTIDWTPTDNGGSMNVTDGNQTTLTKLQSCTEYTVIVTCTTGGGVGSPSTEVLGETETGSKLDSRQYVHYGDYHM